MPPQPAPICGAGGQLHRRPLISRRGDTAAAP